MAEIFENSRFSAFTNPRMVHLCLVVVIIGPMCRETASKPIVTSVTPAFSLADSPLWLDTDKSVYFIDGIRSLLIRYSEGLITTASLELLDQLKFVVRVAQPNAFVVGSGRELRVYSWDGTTDNTTISANNTLTLTADKSQYIECGKGDSSGRLWVGVSFLGDDSRGRFYSVNDAGTVVAQRDTVNPPAGITWNIAFDRIYYSNPSKKTIVGCSFDHEGGTIGDDCAVVFDFATNNVDGNPDGITVDNAGNLWVACSKSTKVVRIDPVAGKLLTTISFPDTTSITSVEFGGDAFDLMYVTTANDQVSNPEVHEKAGTMFEVTNSSATGVGSLEIQVNWPQG